MKIHADVGVSIFKHHLLRVAYKPAEKHKFSRIRTASDQTQKTEGDANPIIQSSSFGQTRQVGHHKIFRPKPFLPTSHVKNAACIRICPSNEPKKKTQFQILKVSLK
jgi:hypothetical protein